MLALSFVIIFPNRKLEIALESSAGAEISARVNNLDDLVQTIEATRPDALLVALGDNPEAVFAALEKILAPRPLLFFHGPDDSQLILRAMRLGAREYIAPGADVEIQLVSAIERVARDQLLSAAEGAARKTEGSAERRSAPLIALIGAKGGVGTSFVACQLGASLARMGRQTALVDGHLRHGDLALYLDLSPAYTFASLATRGEPVDFTYLDSALIAHSSGVQVLAAPKNPEEADTISVSCVETVVDLLRAEFEWLIWDTPRDFDDHCLFILDQADVILLITTPDVPAMNHIRMQLEVLERLGHPVEKIRIVVNRAESGASVSSRDAEKFLKRPVDVRIPNDYRRASACVNEGRTIAHLAPRSALGQAVYELAFLAHSWCDRPLPPSRRGLLNRLREKVKWPSSIA